MKGQKFPKIVDKFVCLIPITATTKLAVCASAFFLTLNKSFKVRWHNLVGSLLVGSTQVKLNTL